MTPATNPAPAYDHANERPSPTSASGVATVAAISNRLDALTHETSIIQSLARRLSANQPQVPPHSVAPTAPARMSLRLSCLGPFEASLGGKLLKRSDLGKGWVILKALASRPRQLVHQDVLIAQLWPQADPTIAVDQLQVATHALQQATTTDQHGSLIQFHDGWYRVDPAIDLWCDIEAFQSAWAAGQQAQQDAHYDLAAMYYRQALALYRGDFFEEEPYDMWTQAPREELRAIYLIILDWLGQYALRSGDYAGALAHWRILLVHAPWREENYRQMMAGLTDQRRQALRWYELCRPVMTGQISITPEPQTTQLYKRILAGEETGLERSVGE